MQIAPGPTSALGDASAPGVGLPAASDVPAVALGLGVSGCGEAGGVGDSAGPGLDGSGVAGGVTSTVAVGSGATELGAGFEALTVGRIVDREPSQPATATATAAAIRSVTDRAGVRSAAG